jgi:hypothetical protein
VKTITITIRKHMQSGTYDIHYGAAYSGWVWPENLPGQVRKDIEHALQRKEAKGTAWHDPH